MLRQWSMITSLKMHSVSVLTLDQGQRLNLYLNHQLLGSTPPQHEFQHQPPKCQNEEQDVNTHIKHTKSMTADEKCTCGFLCLPEYHTLTQNKKNPETILPVLPCLPHANWRLMEEMDHIDRLPSSQQRQ